MLEVATKTEAAKMASFMVTMAYETERKKLNNKIVKKAVQYLIESDYGTTIIKKVKGEPVAAMFLTYQNQHIWWISSVFVIKPFRGKGIFSELFQYAKSLALSKGIGYFRLYVQQTNQKAKSTYQHLGMYVTDDKFYGYDLVLDQEILFLDNPLLKVRKIHNDPDLEGMVDICGMEIGKNKSLGCFLSGKLQGYCQYFLEFSEWRFGLTVYISTLFIRKGEIGKEILTQFFEYLRRYQDLNVSTLRIITKKYVKDLEYLAPKIKKLKYDILEIKFQQNYAKL